MYANSSSDNVPSISLASLPLDIILYIARLVDHPRFLLALMAVNKNLQNKIKNSSHAAQVDQYWCDLFKQHFPRSPYPISTMSSSLMMYKQAHQKRNNALSSKSPELRSLFNWIRWNELARIQSLQLNEQILLQEKDNEGYTAISLACHYNRHAILRHFFNQGVALSEQGKANQSGFQPIHWAVACGLAQEVKKLILRDPSLLKVKTQKESSLLFLASKYGHLEIVEYLLAHKAKVDRKSGWRHDSASSTPLFTAAKRGHLEIVKCLLAHQAKVDKAVSLYDITPLYIAAQNGHLEIVKCLLAHQARVNQSISYGPTALFVAAEKGHLEVVKCLLAHNAKVDHIIRDGSTPLSIAAQTGHRDIYAMLTLWKSYQDQQHQPLCSQLETILLASLEIPSLTTKFIKPVISFFFNSTEQGFNQEIITALHQCPNQNINALKSIIEQYRAHIEPLKYEFIQCHIFKDKTLELEKGTRIEMKK